MRLETGYDERRARIEMVPLMDVVFLLLVFFIYAMFTMSVHRGVRVNLPRGPGEQVPGRPAVIVVRADDSLQLDGRDLSASDVLLETIDRHRRDGVPVLISADRQARLGAAVELLSRLQAAGVDAVTVQVQTP